MFLQSSILADTVAEKDRDLKVKKTFEDAGNFDFLLILGVYEFMITLFCATLNKMYALHFADFLKKINNDNSNNNYNNVNNDYNNYNENYDNNNDNSNNNYNNVNNDYYNYNENYNNNNETYKNKNKDKDKDKIKPIYSFNNNHHQKIN